MRTKLLAVMISVAGCAGFLGCSTEADYREDANAPPADTAPSTTDSTSMDQTTTDRSTDAGAAMSGAATLGAFEEWDTDASGDVSRTEFDSRFASLPAWSDWDVNSDQSLDENEAKNVTWLESESWSELDSDGDGRLAREEAAEALWKKSDANTDNKIEQIEWQEVAA